MTKPELTEVKAAAEGAAAAPAAAAASQDSGVPVKLEPGRTAPAATAGGPGDSSQSSAAAAGPAAPTGPAPLKALTLQHQLLSAADVAKPNSAHIVAGGVPPRKAGDDNFRALMLCDLVAVLERHPLYCRSPELYTLHTLAAMQADSMI